MLHCNNGGLLRAAELAAGGVDRIAFAVAEFHADARLFQDRAERLATLGRRRVVGEASDRVVGDDDARPQVSHVSPCR
jgi:2-methylisocitrate lyase-like PEP mutase family enzyme